MIDVVQHEFFGPLLLILLSIWPLARIFKQQGKNPLLALLVALNILPFVGWIAIGIALLRKKSA